MDQRWRFQPEPTALFLYKHKTKYKKQVCLKWGGQAGGRQNRRAMGLALVIMGLENQGK
jgi:hypothetical protein